MGVRDDWGAGSPDSTLRLDEAASAFAAGAVASAHAPLDTGKILMGRYRIVRYIAAGGMGQVYEAEDQMLGVRVALKLLAPRYSSSPRALERFRREIDLARRVTHPHVCRIHDLGVHREDGRELMFLTMELLDGETLAARIARSGRMSTADALPVITQVAHALAAAHRAGVVHRDLKASNVMLIPAAEEPGGMRVVVTDFGVARVAGDGLRAAADASAELRDTTSGSLEGTPAYMAPEQLEGGPPTPAADLYALGLVMFELVTGVLPMRGDTALATAALRVETPAPSPRTLVPDLDARWEAAILRCLERDPRRRFASAIEVLAALSPRGGRRGWSARVAVIAVAAAVLLGAGAAALRKSGTGGSAPVSVHSLRRITFDAKCEEFPSFTPDGQTLVYDGVEGGDYEIIALDLASGARRRLTHSPGWDYKAQVSPDGKEVAYLHMSEAGRDLRVLPIEGDDHTAPVALGPAIGAPAWTADGAVMAGTSHGDLLRWYHEGGGWRREIVRQLPSRKLIRYLAPTRNGHVLAFWQLPPDGQRTELVDLAPDGAVRVLAPAEVFNSVALALTPAQDAVYFPHPSVGADNELVRQPLDGGERLVVPGAISPHDGVAISPDGKRFAYSTCGEANFLARLRPGGTPAEIVPRRTWRDSIGARLDRDRIIVRSNRSGRDQIWLLDLKSGEARVLTGPNTFDPALSPDRRLLAYVDRERPGIYLLPMDGGAPRRVTDNPSDASPNFSADGSRLVFLRGPRLHVVPAAGGLARAISELGTSLIASSPVGDRVAYLVPGERHLRLMLTDFAGTAHMPVPGLPLGDYADIRFSPDGKRLLLIANRTQLVEVTLDASAAPVVHWDAGLDGIYAADYAPDGEGYLLALSVWEGDLWLAEGKFR